MNYFSYYWDQISDNKTPNLAYNLRWLSIIIRLSVVSMRRLCGALLDAHSRFIISILHMRKQTWRS